ncbi:MAG: hypothetical protein M3P12_15740 [Gemmatimonadota bacterium]|nr:hypothetical protein [Gemmatimonadota bacterium]
MLRLALRKVGLLSAVLTLAACASSGTGSSAAPDRLTRAEITHSNASTAYELINRLRPNWLRATAVGSISGGASRTQSILVYLDGQRLEDLNALKTISAAGIQSAEWIDSTRAATVLRDAPPGPIAGAILLKTL